ncbi:MAG TPA: hypothetical protein VIM11_15010, partial [Tepidisphaeraceae bacterium]
MSQPRVPIQGSTTGHPSESSGENARFGTLVFPHLTRRWTRDVPNHGLEGRATLDAMARDGAQSF